MPRAALPAFYTTWCSPRTARPRFGRTRSTIHRTIRPRPGRRLSHRQEPPAGGRTMNSWPIVAPKGLRSPPSMPAAHQQVTARSGAATASDDQNPTLAHARVLARVGLFAGLDRVALGRLAGAIDVLALDGDAEICRRGEPAGALFVVARGACGVFVGAADGAAERLARILRAGDIIGDTALLTGEAHAATVRTLEAAELLRLDGTEFAALVQREPAVGRAVIHSLSRRLQAHDRAAGSVGAGGAAPGREVRPAAPPHSA